MTRDDIIKMARDAGFVAYGEDMGEYRIPAPAMHSRLERFAALVAAAERERCKTAVAEEALAGPTDSDGDIAYCNAIRHAIDAIRAMNDEVTG